MADSISTPATGRTERDPHVHWAARTAGLEAAAESIGSDDARDAILAAVYPLDRQIAATPAVSIAGILVKLRLFDRDRQDGYYQTGEDAFVSALADLQRVAERISDLAERFAADLVRIRGEVAAATAGPVGRVEAVPERGSTIAAPTPHRAVGEEA